LSLRHDQSTGRATPAVVVIVALAIAVCGGGLYAVLKHGNVRVPEPAAPAAVAVPASVSAPVTPTTLGSIDSPSAEAVLGTRIAITGWALDPAGIRSVDVRVEGVPYAARYGIARPDVALVKPGSDPRPRIHVRRRLFRIRRRSGTRSPSSRPMAPEIAGARPQEPAATGGNAHVGADSWTRIPNWRRSPFNFSC
jgi:hypothetical protein